MEFSSAKTSVLVFANLLLVAIALFSAGPQLGSLDADGDGVPEVPIIISAPSSAIMDPSHAAAFPHSLTKDQRTSIIAVVGALFAEAPCNVGPAETQLVPDLHDLMLHSFEPLRC